MWRASQAGWTPWHKPILVFFAGVLVLAGCNGEPVASSKGAVDRPGIQAALGDILPGDAAYHDLIGDLSSSLTINGALWQWPVAFGTGSGVLDPFLDGQQQGNNTTEEMFNTDGAFTLDQGRTTFTDALPLNRVPVINVGGTSYREFILDANEANSPPDAQFSIDLFDVWLCNSSTAKTFTTVDQFAGAAAPCVKIYNIVEGAKNTGLATDEATSGSGQDLDYRILIPDTKFTGAVLPGGGTVASCPYNPNQNPDCGIYLIFHLKMGFLSVTTPPDDETWQVGSTFEEMSTIIRPFVTVTKTAVPSFTRKYLWQIQKSVDPTAITLFTGQNQDATWTVTVTPQNPAFLDLNPQVTGTITITNTSGAAVTILSIADAIPGYGAVALVCPSGTTNVVLASGTVNNPTTYVCTYSVTAPNANAGLQTNTATVTIFAGSDVQGAEFTGTATFDFGNATPTEIDKNPPVFDDYNGGGEVQVGTASQSPFVTVRNYACNTNEGSFTNVARVDVTNPPADPTATATLVVKCVNITVSKTSIESRTDTYNWLIDKVVTPATWQLFTGDAGTSAYTVTVTPNGITPAGHSVSGVITITGDASDPVTLISLGDAISPGGFAPVPFDCEDNAVDIPGGLTFPYTLLAGHVITCDYTQALPNSDTRLNTATVAARPTAADATHQKNFTGTASVDFTGAVLTEVYKTVHVDDTFAGGPQDALVSNLGAPTVFNYNRTFNCDADAGTHDNTATITETGQSDNASVTVTCRTVTVSKNATTSFNRDFNWDIDKQADQTALIMTPGQTVNVNYDVIVTKSAAINSNWSVTGTITITHNNTARGALLNSLSDVVTTALAATLSNCNVSGAPFTFPGTLGVGATLTCTYTRALPDGTSRTNTATTVQQNHSYSSTLVATPTGTTNWSGTAAVTFSATPTITTDNCADVDDTFSGGPQDTNICASQTFEYVRAVLAPAGVCTDFTVDNTATVTPSTDPPESDNVSIPVDVQCPEGCTLTLGYWKTHNLLFPGGAPLDDTWDIIGGPSIGFFTTSASYPVVGPNTPPFSWFTVFWTAPKGNAYYNLAHQYMAAKLNILNNASAPTAVTDAIAAAEALFVAWTPAQIGALKGNDALRAQFITNAGILGSYNEGAIGPGHCTEDQISLLSLIR